MPQLTAEDRAFLTSHLTQTKDLVLAEVAHLRPDQWAFRPDEETWSIAEGADHIVCIERLIFSMVSKRMQSAEPNPQRAAEVQRKTPWLLEAVLNRQERMKVPAGIENATRSATPEEFAETFKERRNALIEYVSETDHKMHDRVSPHVVFKDLDGCQWLLLISLHGQRHALQMAGVKQHPEFPK